MSALNNTVAANQGQQRKAGARVLPLLGLLSLIAGLQAGTQFFAATFDYHAALGESFDRVYRDCAQNLVLQGEDG